MNKETALKAQRLFISKGYTVSVVGRPADPRMVPMRPGPTSAGPDEPSFHVSLVDLRYDTKDLRAICDLADSVGLVAQVMQGQTIFLAEPSFAPESVHGKRPHPLD